jgi:alpha-glucosidase
VEAQTGDPASVLELTRRTLRLRRAEPALGDGDLDWLSRPGDDCLVLRRPAGDTEPHVLVALNLGTRPALVRATEVLLTSGAELAADEEDDGFWLAPDTAAWLR